MIVKNTHGNSVCISDEIEFTRDYKGLRGVVRAVGYVNPGTHVAGDIILELPSKHRYNVGWVPSAASLQDYPMLKPKSLYMNANAFPFIVLKPKSYKQIFLRNFQ